MTAYSGTMWLDAETARVLRFKVKAEKIPKDFPLEQAEISSEYRPARVGDEEVLLPAKAEVLGCAREANDCYRNEIEFRDYKKFTAEATVGFERP
jgi:hypothetical protein